MHWPSGCFLIVLNLTDEGALHFLRPFLKTSKVPNVISATVDFLSHVELSVNINLHSDQSLFEGLKEFCVHVRF